VKHHKVRTYKSAERLDRADQLAWKIAAVAADPVGVEADVAGMIGNRIIDNAAVAAASIARHPVATARAQAQAHPQAHAATVFGLPSGQRYQPEWAAWANGVAVRELDFHDTFLAADYSHPGDNIPPVLAVAQHCGASGTELLRGLAAAYEIQVDLVKGICLHEHKVDHIAHLGPSAAAGIGALLDLPTETIYQAVQQALHVTTTTRQSRKGEISSWKAYAPAFAGKMAIEVLKPSALIHSTGFHNHGAAEITARAVSVVGAGLGLVFSSPLLAAIALAIKLDSRGPVLFVQERAGRNGRPFRLLKFRTMRPGGAAGTGGVVINVASVAATIAFPGIGVYSATKSGVDRLTRVAAMESGKLGYGVRVNCIYPGLVPTAMGAGLANDVARIGLFGSPEAAVGAVVELTPSGRLGEVADMASAVVFLASDAASFINGVGLPVDGGMGM